MWEKKVWVRGGGAGLGTAVVQEENMSERLEKDERVVEREVKEGGCALVCVKERVSVSPPHPPEHEASSWEASSSRLLSDRFLSEGVRE